MFIKLDLYPESLISEASSYIQAAHYSRLILKEYDFLARNLIKLNDLYERGLVSRSRLAFASSIVKIAGLGRFIFSDEIYKIIRNHQNVEMTLKQQKILRILKTK